MILDIKNESAKILEYSILCIIFIESKLSSVVKCIIILHTTKKGKKCCQLNSDILADGKSLPDSEMVKCEKKKSIVF